MLDVSWEIQQSRVQKHNTYNNNYTRDIDYLQSNVSLLDDATFYVYTFSKMADSYLFT